MSADAEHIRALLKAIRQGYRIVRTEEEFKALPVGARGYFSNYFPRMTFSKGNETLWYSDTGARHTFSEDELPPMPFTRHDQKDLIEELSTYVELLLDTAEQKG